MYETINYVVTFHKILISKNRLKGNLKVVLHLM